eukprot:98812-Pelagomonas_calceolata.AAC.3
MQGVGGLSSFLKRTTRPGVIILKRLSKSSVGAALASMNKGSADRGWTKAAQIGDGFRQRRLGVDGAFHNTWSSTFAGCTPHTQEINRTRPTQILTTGANYLCALQTRF